jgi:hypothetical protein
MAPAWLPFSRTSRIASRTIAASSSLSELMNPRTGRLPAGVA